ncbi:MAG: respiratory nitrate reductase subunit gamma [Gammaproteobacteria bacterium]|nr:MAG: respiratory nitrate reductase subunit gamma [Gammaproteobacteria bacterium]RKZ44068.1 MAG: respiratory nitrate reductase subunit gamma [Gammaproteobacteria bacterium]RKZ75992.1 MAG: respiratory nitrate reductase subunit gamma [Gammaproteobacteria bacterium]
MTVDQLLYGVFPYVCIVVAIVATLYRYLTDRFSYSSLSSQFLENRQLFWGSVAWHYGILGVLTAHLVGFLIPQSILWWNMEPVRLYILETTGFVLGLLALVGLLVLIYRRLTNSRIRVVTSPMDVTLLVVLLIQVVAGVGTAIFYRWGSSWYSAFAVPYLWSILAFKPDVTLVNNLPFVVQVHILNAFVLVLILPFTRLVHFLSVPIKYIWRPHQIVRWNRRSPIIGA